MQNEKKKQFKMPHSFVIIMCIVIAATILTWIVPAGSYVRVENAAGVKVVDPNQFSFINKTPVNPLLVPLYIVQSMISRIDIMLVIMFSGGAFELITMSGALQSFVGKIAKIFQHKLYVFIPIMTTLFALICTTQGVNQFIAFAPIFVMISIAMGLDSIVGAALILLGGAVGFATGTLNPSTTVVAQGIAELPIYSGIGYRWICFAVFLVITNIYLVRYAMKVQKDPTLSPMYELDLKREEKTADMDQFGNMNLRKFLILAVLVGSLAAIVIGCIQYKWDMPEMASMFLALGIVVGFIDGRTPSEIAKIFVKGVEKMMTAALIIGLAGAIASIMKAGNIVDTVIYGMAGILKHTPSFLMAPMMYIVNTLINFVIVSGSGQAAAIMPIITPLSDILGITRQTTVLAYNFGDGFCNYILPHSTALMGIISAVNIPYDRWIKFMWKLFLIWVFFGCIMIGIAQAIHYGPM
ncbi:MAG: Na+/H+ antiporter NhaC family protein [Bacillota bacterium]|nr:Na+/H+ antiporter NhaC family protein [Bacillota bacterium]